MIKSISADLMLGLNAYKKVSNHQIIAQRGIAENSKEPFTTK